MKSVIARSKKNLTVAKTPALYRPQQGITQLAKASHYNEWSINTMSIITKSLVAAGFLLR